MTTTSANVIPIDEASFEAEVLGSPLPFLLDVSAPWCRPCEALAPIVGAIADDHVGTLRVGILDMDACPALASRLGIRGAPTVIAFRGGVETGRQLGLASRAR